MPNEAHCLKDSHVLIRYVSTAHQQGTPGFLWGSVHVVFDTEYRVAHWRRVKALQMLWLLW